MLSVFPSMSHSNRFKECHTIMYVTVCHNGYITVIFRLKFSGIVFQ